MVLLKRVSWHWKNYNFEEHWGGRREAKDLGGCDISWSEAGLRLGGGKEARPHNMPRVMQERGRKNKRCLESNLFKRFLKLLKTWKTHFIGCTRMVKILSLLAGLRTPHQIMWRKECCLIRGLAGRYCWKWKQPKCQQAIKAVQETGQTSYWPGRQTDWPTDKMTRQKKCQFFGVLVAKQRAGRWNKRQGKSEQAGAGGFNRQTLLYYISTVSSWGAYCTRMQTQ